MRTTIFLTVLLLILGLSVLANGSDAQGKNKDGQALRVEITEQGFQPDSLKLKVNVPAHIIFTRHTDKTCVREVLIQDYGIKKELPLNEPVIVEFTPKKKGDFTFACGMNMLRGKVIVQ